MQFPFHLKPSQVVAIEGLDGTGKSTIIQGIENACHIDMEVPMFTPSPMFVHMPSGSTRLGANVYSFTERHKIKDPMARQHLHWASHREEYRRALKPALEAGRTVFFDRFWWSAVAYCWFGNESVQEDWPLEDFIEVCRRALPVEPSIVLLFTEPHVEDEHNTAGVREGYEWLETEYKDEHPVVRIPALDSTRQRLAVYDALASHGIYKNEA